MSKRYKVSTFAKRYGQFLKNGSFPENLWDLFRSVQRNDVKAIERLTAKGKIDLTQRGAAGESLLHVAALRDHYEAAILLLEKEPSLVDMAYESKLYFGETALHIAIINQNLRLVQALVEKGAHLEKSRAVGRFFTPCDDCQCYYGEFPLSFAVCTGQPDIVKYLVEKGASLNAQDHHGNTALHLLALKESINPKSAKKMYDIIISLDPDDKLKLNSIRNILGFTPSQYATHLGHVELVEHILFRRQQVLWTYGSVSTVIYDLEDIDTFHDGKCQDGSLLELSVKCAHKNASKFLSIQPLGEILQHKYLSMRPWVYSGAIFYVIYMTLLTLIAYYRPLPKPTIETVTISNASGLFNITRFIPNPDRRITLFDAYDTRESSNNARLVAEVIVLAWWAVITIGECLDLNWLGWRLYFLGKGCGAFNILRWVHIIIFLTTAILRVFCHPREEIALALLMLTGWAYMLFYSRLFAKLGPYVVMLETILCRDMLRFISAYFCILIGYSAAFVVMYSDVQLLGNTELFGDFGLSMLTLIKAIVGLQELPLSVFNLCPTPSLAIVVYVSYLILVAILFVTSLVAMVTHTYDKEYENHILLWKKQVLLLALQMEQKIPSFLRKSTGINGVKLGLTPDKSYFKIIKKSSTIRKIQLIRNPSTLIREVDTRKHKKNPWVNSNGKGTSSNRHPQNKQKEADTGVRLVSESYDKPSVDVADIAVDGHDVESHPNDVEKEPVAAVDAVTVNMASIQEDTGQQTDLENTKF
ncbi:unnamed protein product [Owenia fusiformis]|uniref:Uncharacterized protein n=1 Tax=Owenia fusiformis TaxID=6347 RepID=A0A8J1TKS4_OWEFU|nr:unnamed protein product [Owenia fusiformis]